MPLIKYENLRFHSRIVAQIKQATDIIAEYSQQGYELTLRQLYYQFVARGLLPNTQKNYKALGSTISKARRAGLIDWEAIVDRTRFLRSQSSWDSPTDILGSASYSFKYDRWKSQEHYVEVWFEKDALLGVFERPSRAWRVPIFSCRGYTSDSEVWSAAQRIKRQMQNGKDAIILHFGDHDPSGLDMTRDIEDRLELFGAEGVRVKRLALNMAQIEEHEPPPNPAKESDSRFAAYREKFGDESWELDALDPKLLNELVRKALMGVLDIKAWNAAVREENAARIELVALQSGYSDVVERMREDGDIERMARRLRRDNDVRIENLLDASGLRTLDDDGDEGEE